MQCAYCEWAVANMLAQVRLQMQYIKKRKIKADSTNIFMSNN